MMTDARREDLRKRIAAVATYKDLAGATVLEIGADAHGHAAQMLLDAGAARVLSSNHGERWPVETVGAIARIRLDARRIADEIAPASIDLVFGIAVLEHIDGLDAFFAGAKQALAPGGLFFVQGGPIWTSAVGHHVGVKGEKAHYRFGVEGANPIPPWAHLVHDRETLPGALGAQGVWPADAQLIADFVYASPKLNRVGYRSMREAFDASPLAGIDRIEAAFQPPPADMMARIARGPYAGQERYDVASITFVAR